MITRWDYKTVLMRSRNVFRPLPDPEQVERELKELGEAGWELVSVVPDHRGWNAVLKRPR